MSAGNVKRDRIQKLKEDLLEKGQTVQEASIAENLPEQEVGIDGNVSSVLSMAQHLACSFNAGKVLL